MPVVAVPFVPMDYPLVRLVERCECVVEEIPVGVEAVAVDVVDVESGYVVEPVPVTLPYDLRRLEAVG